MFQREDWQVAIEQAKGEEPLVMEQPLFERRNTADKAIRKQTFKVEDNEY